MFKLNRELSSVEKLFVIIICLCLGFLFNSLVVGLLYPCMQGEVAYKVLLTLSSLLSFGLPSLAAAYLIGENSNPLTNMGLTRKVKISKCILAIIFMLAITPTIELLTSLNASYSFPESMKGMEEYFRNTDARAMEATQRALAGNGTISYIMNLIAIAITPAICEEMFFRGILQKHLVGAMKNKHVAILFTALIFSVIHMQFSGLLPRFVLGAALGYMFYASKSLWLSIAAHATNNALVISIAYFSNNDVTMTNDLSAYANTWWILAIAIGIAIAILTGRQILCSQRYKSEQ